VSRRTCFSLSCLVDRLGEADLERRRAQLIEFGMVDLSSTGKTTKGV